MLPPTGPALASMSCKAPRTVIRSVETSSLHSIWNTECGWDRPRTRIMPSDR